MDAFPCQPQCGSLHEICSSPNISMALLSESDATEHFRWKLMSWPPLGHSNTILYALLIVDNTSFSNFARLNRKSLLRVLTPGRSLPSISACGPILRTATGERLAFAETVMLALMMAALLTGRFSEVYSCALAFSLSMNLLGFPEIPLLYREEQSRPSSSVGCRDCILQSDRR